MSAPRTAQRVLTATFAVAALVSSACLEDVVVGTQQGAIDSLDAGSDASLRLDSSAEPDARPPEPDAAPPDRDAGALDAAPPPDAAEDDGGPIVILKSDDASLGTDAGCGATGCAADAAVDAAQPLGPCSACDPVSISTGQGFFDGCADGKGQVCWENEDNTCSRQCPPTKTCAETSDCAPDQYCFYPENDCGKDSVGWCAPRPRGDCGTIGSPVCGCDGKPYRNGCEAVKAGVAVGVWPDGSGPVVCSADAGA